MPNECRSPAFFGAPDREYVHCVRNPRFLGRGVWSGQFAVRRVLEARQAIPRQVVSLDVLLHVEHVGYTTPTDGGLEWQVVDVQLLMWLLFELWFQAACQF